MKPIPAESKILYDAALFQRLKYKNQTGQQRKQAVAAVSIYYQIKRTDQGKTDILKTKNADISTKKVVFKLAGADWSLVYGNLIPNVA